MIRVLAAAALASCLSAPVLAAQIPSDFAELRAKDTRVLRIGYELATGNAAFCDRVTPSIGLLLHDVGAYGEAGDLGRALGLQGAIGVQAVVPGSPAEKAGLSTDQSITLVDGLNVGEIELDRQKRWKRLETVLKRLDRSLAETGTLTIAMMSGVEAAEITIEGVPACRSRFEVGQVGKRAVADGERVVIGTEFPGHAYPDELLAAVMAHELAHNVLGHRAWFDANGGRKQRAVRLTEREADRLMPWLLANAGYPPSAATRFMQTWGPSHSGGIFRKRTHDGWDERAEFIAAEAIKAERQLAATGTADWRTHFEREQLPAED